VDQKEWRQYLKLQRSRSTRKTKMVKTQSVKFEIEKFNGKRSFEIWKVKMHDFLVQQGVVNVLVGKLKKPTSIIDEEWEKIDVRELSGICFCLADDVIFNIVTEKTTVGL
jgi:hypothetical protein